MCGRVEGFSPDAFYFFVPQLFFMCWTGCNTMNGDDEWCFPGEAIWKCVLLSHVYTSLCQVYKDMQKSFWTVLGRVSCSQETMASGFLPRLWVWTSRTGRSLSSDLVGWYDLNLLKLFLKSDQGAPEKLLFSWDKRTTVLAMTPMLDFRGLSMPLQHHIIRNLFVHRSLWDICTCAHFPEGSERPSTYRTVSPPSRAPCYLLPYILEMYDKSTLFSVFCDASEVKWLWCSSLEGAEFLCQRAKW